VENDLKETLRKVEKLNKDNKDLEKAIQFSRAQTEESIKAESQAKEKLMEAIVMAQEALKNEASIAG
jgi:hypothetical protein